MASLTSYFQSLKLSSSIFTHGSTPLHSLLSPDPFSFHEDDAMARVMRNERQDSGGGGGEAGSTPEIQEAREEEEEVSGDVVRLEKSGPISKTKSFVALPLAKRNDLQIPMESQQPAV